MKSGFKVKLPQYNRHFYIITIEVSQFRCVEAMQLLKGMGCFFQKLFSLNDITDSNEIYIQRCRLVCTLNPNLKMFAQTQYVNKFKQ